jgi:hypothetical protein
MLEFFDFSHRTFAQPPALATATVNDTQLAACASMPSNTGV